MCLLREYVFLLLWLASEKLSLTYLGLADKGLVRQKLDKFAQFCDALVQVTIANSKARRLVSHGACNDPRPGTVFLPVSQGEYMKDNSDFRRLITSTVSTSLTPPYEIAHQFDIQGIIANQTLAKYERKYSPVWAALQALLLDYSDLGEDTKKQSEDLSQLIKGAKTFAEWLLGFEWEDSNMPYQRKAEKQIDALRKAMDDLPTWQDKLKYLVSVGSCHKLHSDTLTRIFAELARSAAQNACPQNSSALESGKGDKLDALLFAPTLLSSFHVYQVETSQKQVGIHRVV